MSLSFELSSFANVLWEVEYWNRTSDGKRRKRWNHGLHWQKITQKILNSQSSQVTSELQGFDDKDPGDKIEMVGECQKRIGIIF